LSKSCSCRDSFVEDVIAPADERDLCALRKKRQSRDVAHNHGFVERIVMTTPQLRRATHLLIESWKNFSTRARAAERRDYGQRNVNIEPRATQA